WRATISTGPLEGTCPSPCTARSIFRAAIRAAAAIVRPAIISPMRMRASEIPGDAPRRRAAAQEEERCRHPDDREGERPEEPGTGVKQRREEQVRAVEHDRPAQRRPRHGHLARDRAREPN